MPAPRLAIDFGTSNSAVAIAAGGRALRLPLEAGAETLPTAVFFPAGGGAMQIGTAAGEALLSGAEGRYMRALKSALGTSLLHEPRLLGGKRRTIAEVITAYLAELRTRAEAMARMPLTRALSGRPVHFHDGDPARDAQAEADLAACYRAAGFEEVAFLPEPEAAARAARGLAADGALGLVVDIGGGTSDFTLFRARGGRAEILASHGIRLGGTDFDQAVSLAHVMPLLGQGGELRREMGAGLLPMPNALFVDLASWPKIPFLYTPETRREVARWRRLAVAPGPVARLGRVLEEELGHELAFAAERGKIAANRGEAGARIAMGAVEPGLAAPIDAGSMGAALAPFAARIEAAIAETLALGGVAPGAVEVAILVGGSSLMGFVRAAVRAACPGAEIRDADAFTAVVDGLALATEE